MAPVRVATSTRCVAPSCRAYHKPSPRIRRPSASVLITSTVFPSALFRTSPGLRARPPGMFSAVGTTPITRIGAPSIAMARIAQATAAPPAMSSFMRSMPSAGLIEMPPVSNVIPLPTSPSTGPRAAPGGSWRNTISRGGSLLPRATPRSMPIPSASIRFSSSTSTPTPASPATADARAANSRGVSVLPGSFASPRAALLQSPRTRPRAMAASMRGSVFGSASAS